MLEVSLSFIQVSPGGRGEDVVINKIPTTIQPKVLNVTLEGESKTEVVVPTVTDFDADRAKDKLEVFEKRLRIMSTSPKMNVVFMLVPHIPLMSVLSLKILCKT